MFEVPTCIDRGARVAALLLLPAVRARMELECIRANRATDIATAIADCEIGVPRPTMLRPEARSMKRNLLLSLVQWRWMLQTIRRLNVDVRQTGRLFASRYAGCFGRSGRSVTLVYAK